MIECRHAELLSGFIDNQLNAEQTTTLLDHLGSCDACRTDLEALVAIHDAFSRGEVFADTPAPSAVFVGNVMAQLPDSPAAYEAGRIPVVKKYLTPLVEFFRFRPALAGAVTMAAIALTVGGAFMYPLFTQSTLQQVSEIRPHVTTTATEPMGDDIYYHARLNTAYTVGGAPLPIDHALEERF